MDRTDPASNSDELTMLGEYLDYHRATLVMKASGLDRAQLATPLPPSTLTLAGLLKHAALVEDSWFGAVLLGEPERDEWAVVDWDADPDWEFRTGNDEEPAQLVERYAAACERSRAAVAQLGDPAALSVGTRRRTGERVSVRWVMLHMIEETARHNGHADFLRENIDGVTGE
jgi:hypothetical protein